MAKLRLSYSAWSAMARCKRQGQCYLRRKPAEVVRAERAATGSYWHGVLAAALRAKQPALDVDGITLKLDWLTKGKYWVERKDSFTLQVGDTDVTMVVIPDLMLPGRILDAKFGRGEIDSENLPSYYRLQAEVYCYYGFMHPSVAPEGKLIYSIINGRFGNILDVARYTTADVPRLHEQMIDLAKQSLELAESEAEARPEPGDGCGLCNWPLSCPVMAEIRIASPEDAALAAQGLRQAEAQAKARREALQGWALEHGPVALGDGTVYGQKRGEATEIDADKVWSAVCKCGERTCQKSGLFTPSAAAIKKAAKESPDLANAVTYTPGGGQARWTFWKETKEDK